MGKKSETGLDDLILSSSQAAKLIMVSLTALYEREREGWIKRTAQDQWNAVAVVRGNNRYLADRAKRASQTGTLSRMQAAKARSIEARNAREAGETTSVKESLAFVSEVIGAFVSKLGSLPARCSRDLSLRAVIQREVDGLRDETARHYETLAAAYLAQPAGGLNP